MAGFSSQSVSQSVTISTDPTATKAYFIERRGFVLSLLPSWFEQETSVCNQSNPFTRIYFFKLTLILILHSFQHYLLLLLLFFGVTNHEVVLTTRVVSNPYVVGIVRVRCFAT